jgi:hypothetical protein
VLETLTQGGLPKPQSAAVHKTRIDKQLKEHELQLHKAPKAIGQLILENKKQQLKELFL